MKSLLFSSLAGVAALLGPAQAQATSVYPGCAVPSLRLGHHTFYIDPVKGSMKGDGSAAKPWRTLAEVVTPSSKLLSSKARNDRTFKKGDWTLIDQNPAGPIKAGDVLMLMSGHHGNVSVGNVYNQDFITVMAAPGQTPIVDSMGLVSSGKFLFQGIKFQGMTSLTSMTGVPVSSLVNVGRGDFLGPTSDIVFDNDSFSATDDTSAWKGPEWYYKPYVLSLFGAPTANCMSVTNSHFYNGMNGVQLASSNSIAENNFVEHMSNDGFDVTASNLILRRNLIKDGVYINAIAPSHPDGIQGWSLTNNNSVVLNKNVLIDSNTVLKMGDPNKSFMQGITIFDGQWDGVTITNNVVYVNNFQGISLYGATNSSIVNNTVIASKPDIETTWITVNASKTGQSSAGVVVRNNIASTLNITGNGATVDHNLVLAGIVMPSNGGVMRLSSGSTGVNNLIVPSLLGQLMSPGTFDFRPRPNSIALGYGSSVGAPAKDMLGKARAPTVSAGAYN